MNSSILGGRRNNCFFCSGLNFNNPIGYLLMIEVMWKRPCQQVLQLKNVLHRVINILGHPDNTRNGKRWLLNNLQFSLVVPLLIFAKSSNGKLSGPGKFFFALAPKVFNFSTCFNTLSFPSLKRLIAVL